MPRGARRAVTLPCGSDLNWLLGSSSHDAAEAEKRDHVLLPFTPLPHLELCPRSAGGARGGAAFS